MKDETVKISSIEGSRLRGFAVIVAVYVLATVTGIYLYEILPWNYLLNIFVSDVVATLIVYLFSMLSGNASMYDPYWSVQPIVILCVCVLQVSKSSCNVTILGVLFFIVICIWGIRLTANWAYTFHGLKYQDWRYTMLREKTGIFYPLINLLGIHLFPTIVVYTCVIPAVIVIRANIEGNVWTVSALLISLLGTIIQGTADAQMHRFRKSTVKPEGSINMFIRTGLWKYARHPNYLGEIMMWWGIALAAVTVLPDQWYLLIGAVINHLMFLGISIPLADGHQSRKPGFAEYRKQTRMLLPVKK